MGPAAKIGFIVEGDTDKVIVETLARRVLGPGFHVHAVRLGGKAALPWAYATALMFLEEKGYAHVAVVMDADSAVEDEVASQAHAIKSSLAQHQIKDDEATVSMAVPMIEAWLLAEYVERPEAETNPKAEIARRLGAKSVSAAQAEELASRLDLRRARLRSPSFERFAGTLERVAQGLRTQAPAA